METVVAQPIYTVVYEGKDITRDIAKYLISINYDDAIEGESSSLEIVLEDEDGLWKNGWYPTKGDTITATIENMNCGNFVIDETTLSGPPDKITIRCLENILTSKAIKERNLRTKRTRAHEGKSLKQIAQAVAKANNLTLEGKVPEIVIERVTQHRVSDLKFLRKIAFDFGCIFSVRDNKLIYTSLYDIDKRSPSFVINKSDIIEYELKDKTSGVFKDATIAYHNPKTRQIISHSVDANDIVTVRNNDGLTYTQITSGDTLVVNKKVENKQQAEAVVTAHLYRANSHQQSGRVKIPGNEYALSGNIYEQLGLGVAGSGHFCILKASHKVDRDNAWQVEMDVKRVAIVSKAKQKGIPGASTGKTTKNKVAVGASGPDIRPQLEQITKTLGVVKYTLDSRFDVTFQQQSDAEIKKQIALIRNAKRDTEANKIEADWTEIHGGIYPGSPQPTKPRINALLQYIKGLISLEEQRLSIAPYVKVIQPTPETANDILDNIVRKQSQKTNAGTYYGNALPTDPSKKITSFD